MSKHFQSIFQQHEVDVARGKFLSRVFGIFSEDIVRLWTKDDRSPYEDLGRPTVKQNGVAKGYTLDFTLRHAETGKTYITELKCEIEYQNYRYLVLTETSQLEHHRKPAFSALLGVAKKKDEYTVVVNKEKIEVDGALLIWGAATVEGRETVRNSCGFADILTMADIINDLQKWEHKDFNKLLENRRGWTNELFDQLRSP